ncbi:MAG: acetamidase/formamidase family protein, partial [Alphaproteobacteria bacterium]|nr:acetamidase/formamidase family protein [Alphaproteobacteria bacterium]
MCVACNHTIHRAQHNFGWNNDFPPALVAKPGETILFECLDSSGGQLGPGATLDTLASLDFDKVNPVSGPVYVEGAEPGDALKVTIRKFHPCGHGWTANIPGFGLLADQFKDPTLHLWSYDTASMAPAAYGPGGKVPLKP